MPRKYRLDPLDDFLPRGITKNSSAFVARVNLLGRHVSGAPRYLGSFPEVDLAAVVLDSADTWLRYGGTPPPGFVFRSPGWTTGSPPPLVPEVDEFGGLCLEAIRRTCDNLLDPFSQPWVPVGLRMFAAGQLPKPVRLF